MGSERFQLFPRCGPSEHMAGSQEDAGDWGSLSVVLKGWSQEEQEQG